MKRLTCIVIAFYMLFSLVSPAYALPTKEAFDPEDQVVRKFDFEDLCSTESPMPTISNGRESTATSNSDTLYMPSRQTWVKETTTYLESLYNQNVCNIQETTDYIVFWFDSDVELNDYSQSPLSNNSSTVVAEGESRGVEGYVLKVMYLKPESTLTESSFNTKIVYMWGWSDGLIQLDASPLAGTAFNVSSTVLLSILAYSVTPLQSIVLSAFQMTVSEFISMYGASRPVRGVTYANYYYQNKIAYAYVQGMWLPGCEIGSRRGFNGSLAGYKTNAGQWIMNKWNQPRVGQPENNPTNYESIEKKNHFDDNAWMMNYAITYYTVYDTDEYIDIYENVYNTLN